MLIELSTMLIETRDNGDRLAHLVISTYRNKAPVFTQLTMILINPGPVFYRTNLPIDAENYIWIPQVSRVSSATGISHYNPSAMS
jgi:hypothetical protein